MSLSNPLTRAYLALAAICVIWSTTYAGIKFAIRDFPPYLLVGLRQTAAGLLLLGWALATGKARLPDRPYLYRQMLTGLCTITGGNGFITWGMQYVSTGLAAVIGALTPVMVVLINVFWRGGETVSRRALLGVLAGFAGLGLIFSHGWRDFLDPQYRLGIVGCFGSCFSWSLGTVMAKRFNSPDVAPQMNAGLQITAGGLGGFVLSALFDPSYAIRHTWEGWISVIYLVLIGSALAFTLYMYVLRHLTATASSLYTYINPLGAILIGWLWLGELLTWWTTLGAAITLLGVWLVGQGEKGEKGERGERVRGEK